MKTPPNENPDSLGATIEHLFGGKETASVTRSEIIGVVAQVAATARAAALTELFTAEEIAGIYGVSARRVRAKAQKLREGGDKLGWRVAGRGTWLFGAADVPKFKAQARGRPRKQPEDPQGRLLHIDGNADRAG